MDSWMKISMKKTEFEYDAATPMLNGIAKSKKKMKSGLLLIRT